MLPKPHEAGRFFFPGAASPARGRGRHGQFWSGLLHSKHFAVKNRDLYECGTKSFTLLPRCSVLKRPRSEKGIVSQPVQLPRGENGAWSHRRPAEKARIARARPSRANLVKKDFRYV